MNNNDYLDDPSSSTNNDNLVYLLIKDHWDLYFPFDDFSIDLPWFNAAKIFRAFLNGSQRDKLGNGSDLLADVDIERATEVIFDYQQWCSSMDMEGELAAFSTVLRDNASITLKCIGLALCSLRRRRQFEDGLAPLSNRITPRFSQYREITSIRALKSNMLGKFVAIRGTVIRV